MTRRGVLSGLAGAAALISVVTVVSRLLGFARTLVFTRAVGYDSVTAGLYTQANVLPNVLFEVAAGGALAGALIPLVAGPLARGMRDDVSRIASAMLGWALAGLSVLGGLLALLAEPVAALAADPGPSRDMVVFFVRVFALQVPLYGLAVVLSGVLQAQRRFFWPAFAPILSSLVVIGSYAGYGALLRGGGVEATAAPGSLPDGAVALLAWGTTAGVAAMGLPLLVPVARSGVRLRPTLRFPPGVAARARALAAAGIGGLVAQQLAILAVTWWLLPRFGTHGSVAVYQNAVQAVYVLPYAVLAVPLATSTFPRLAERAARPGRAGYAGLAAVTTRAVLVAAVVGAAVLVAVAPAAQTVFGVIGTSGGALVGALAPSLTLIAPGLIGMALIFHVSRALYAVERGRLAVGATAVGWATVVLASWVACLVLVPGAPDGGAALRAVSAGTSVGMLVGAAALLVALRAAAGAEALHGLVRTLAVLLAGGAVGAVLGRWLVDAVGGAAGGLPGAVAAAALGAVVAVAVVVGAVVGGDRSTVRGLTRRGGGAASGTGDGVAEVADAVGVSGAPAAPPATADARPATRAEAGTTTQDEAHARRTEDGS